MEELQNEAKQVAPKEMEGMTQLKTKWDKFQQMGAKHQIEQEVEEFTTIRTLAKEVFNQVKATYDEFLTQLNAPVASN